MKKLTQVLTMQIPLLKMGATDHYKPLIFAAFLAGYIAFEGTGSPAIGLGVWLVMAMNVVVSVKARERQENWLEFYHRGHFSVLFIAFLVPVFVSIILFISVLFALVVGSLAQGVFQLDVEIGLALFLSIVNGAWFYGNLQQILMQLMPLDKIMAFRKLSFFLLIGLFKIWVWLALPFSAIVTVHVAMLAINILCVIPITAFIYKRSFRLISTRKAPLDSF